MSILTAPALFASALGKSCAGTFKCHWCFNPCNDRDLHDDPPPVPFVKSRSGAKNPNGLFVCTGCWEFRRLRVTTKSLTGICKDRQKPALHSWLISKDSALVFLLGEEKKLYDFLLAPTFPFVLSFNRSDRDSYIHMMHINENVTNDKSMLKFTIDNIEHRYSTYELMEGLTTADKEGKEPGVRELINLLGPYEELGNVTKNVPDKKSTVRLPKLKITPV